MMSTPLRLVIPNTQWLHSIDHMLTNDQYGALQRGSVLWAWDLGLAVRSIASRHFRRAQ